MLMTDQALRKIFWKVIVENETGLGEETTFDFKYIPDLSKRTEREEAPTTGIMVKGIERRNLQALVVGCGLLSLVGYLALRVTVAVGERAATAWSF